MKKLMIAMMAVVMILSGCGKKEPVPEETTVPPTTEAAIVETTVETTAPETEPTIEVTEPVATEEATEPPTEVPTESAGEVGVVVNARKLNVREKPSVTARKVMQLDRGTQVTVYETVETAGMLWGRIDQGWVSMDYIRLGVGPAPQQEPADNQYAPEVHSGEDADDSKVSQHDIPAAPAAPHSAERDSGFPVEETVVPEPTQHEHTWVPVRNIPAEYDQHGYVVCICGARFHDTAEWTAHRDAYLGSEDIGSHTGYSSGCDQVEVTPAQVVWQCSTCGSTKTLGAWDNP